MKFSTETLLAYADGELDTETRAAVDAAIAADREVAAAVAAHVGQRPASQSQLRGADDGALHESIPARQVEPPSTPLPSTASVAPDAAQRTPEARWSLPTWGAVAATLVLGVIIGRVAFQPSAALVTTDQGRLSAHGELDTALTTQHGGAFDRKTGIRLGVSYVAKSGEYCRTFTVSQENMLAGLACRRAEQWAIDALAKSNANSVGTYRMANVEVPALILGIVENTISGDALDTDQETEARAKGWRR